MPRFGSTTTRRLLKLTIGKRVKNLEVSIFSDDDVVSLRRGECRDLQEFSEFSVRRKLEILWTSIGPPLFIFLCVNLLLRFSKRSWIVAGNLVNFLVCCWDFPLRGIVECMPRVFQLTHLVREVETLRIRVHQLGNLWRE